MVWDYAQREMYETARKEAEAARHAQAEANRQKIAQAGRLAEAEATFRKNGSIGEPLLCFFSDDAPS